MGPPIKELSMNLKRRLAGALSTVVFAALSAVMAVALTHARPQS